MCQSATPPLSVIHQFCDVSKTGLYIEETQNNDEKDLIEPEFEAIH